MNQQYHIKATSYKNQPLYYVMCNDVTITSTRDRSRADHIVALHNKRVNKA
jgi:hypothetical protein